MEQIPSLETVTQALQALYNNPDVVGKEKASVWLGELQKSVFAWQIADQLLRLNQSLESCYFAAQTMRTKIQYAFHELPQTSHQSLRDSLLEHAGKINPDTPPVIITQLSLALADLALQMATWHGAVGDLLQKFGTNTQHLQFLLEVLTVLPEEINSRSLRLGANRRLEVTEELKQACPVVLQLLEACLETCDGNDRVQAKVFRVLASWFSVAVIPQEHIVNTKLMQAPIQALASRECPSQLHETASDCICAALYCAEDLEKQQLLAQILFDGVQTLPDSYHWSVADEDSDKSVNYCRVFTEMAESFLDEIMKTPNQGLGSFTTMELLLTCVGHYLYEVAEITFNFWYRLSEDLYQRNSKDLNEIYRPYIQRLIVALCQHCQMDPDHDGVPDETGDFGEFRLRVSELIKDVVFIVGSSHCFSQMFDNLKSQSSVTSWETSEASLFIMSAVAKNILPEENEIVPQVLEAILTLPDTAHIAVRFTSIHLIGELCEWIERHPQFLDPVLQFLLNGLQHASLASAAANSLQNISTQCRDHMTEHFEGLVHIVQAMDTFNLSGDAAIGLLKARVIAGPPPPCCQAAVCCVLPAPLANTVNTPQALTTCHRLAAAFNPERTLISRWFTLCTLHLTLQGFEPTALIHMASGSPAVGEFHLMPTHSPAVGEPHLMPTHSPAVGEPHLMPTHSHSQSSSR
ncbi:transportin-3-like [Gigantopelta aegis]|uniref:transportin-3-like n=1 Tax=Gigantopelta aegis TaxID=1735272 RepID=UPI001B88CAB9|nr:transportin-3-like [Gigantopelta aegis]